MRSAIIVSRHRAAIEFVARHLAGGNVNNYWVQLDGPTPCIRYLPPGESDPDCAIMVPVCMGNATADDFRDAIWNASTAYGNIPLHLASVADTVFAIEFKYTPPRGVEYTLAEMDAAGAYLARYAVVKCYTSRDELFREISTGF